MKFDDYNETDEHIASRIKEIKTLGLRGITYSDLLKRIIATIDLTSLEGSDTSERINQLCLQAIHSKDPENNLPGVASVCIYPVFVRTAKKELSGTGVPVVTVAGGFPSGQLPLPLKLAEARYAVDQGADEVDMVISRGKFLEGSVQEVFDEIAQTKEICKHITLKVILETGELQSVSNIRKASETAILAGADFIKTSTGKIQPAATPLAVVVMLDTINEFYRKTGKKTGIKPAGGIAVPESAIEYFGLVRAINGDDWTDKKYFRLGASRLLQNVINEIEKNNTEI